MNNVPMTAKEYLSRAYRIDQRINAKLMRISELRALAQKCTVAYGGERVCPGAVSRCTATCTA